MGADGLCVVERARDKGMGLLGLKSLEDRVHIELALRFTLGLPLTAAIPPGHWDLFKICLEIVEAGAIREVSEEELAPLAKLGEGSRPLFEGVSA